MSEVQCFVVCPNKDRFNGFYVDLSHDNLNKVLACTDIKSLKKAFKLKAHDFIKFLTLGDINEYFNNESTAASLVVYANDIWYYRKRGSNEFVQVPEKNEEEAKEESQKTLEISQKSDIQLETIEEMCQRISTEHTDLIWDYIHEVENDYKEFKEAYAKEQKLSFYVYLVLVILITVVGYIVIFR